MTVLNRLQLRQKIALLFGTFLLIALLITHLIVQSVERISSTSAWTAHTFEVLDQLRMAEVALVRQEMELRDFLLAPSQDVVQSYWQTAYSTSFAKAKELTVDNPAQQVQLDEMNRLAGIWQSMTIEAIRDAGGQEPLTGAKHPHREAALSAFLAKLQTIVAVEQNLLKHREDDRRAAQKRAHIVAIGGGSLLLILALLAGHLLQTDIGRAVTAMTGSMQRLASGNLEEPVPFIDRADELGSMAKAVEVFKQGLAEAERLRLKQVAAQERLELYAVELERSNRELDEFAYIASHDLKAPLRVIGNAARWLEEDLAEHLTDEDRSNMDLLRSRVQRMEKLLDDLLEYSRVGRSSDSRFAETVGGRALIDDILMLLSPPAGFRVEVAPAFYDIAVNRMPLQQVLYNLIANAIKHHDKPAGLIEVGVETEAEDGMYRFTVRDDGPGIPSRFHEQVFKMFQTLKPRDQVEGSGMGLAFVKKTVSYFGGELSLVSEEGQGSAFSFTWPREQKAVGEVQGKAA